MKRQVAVTDSGPHTRRQVKGEVGHRKEDEGFFLGGRFVAEAHARSQQVACGQGESDRSVEDRDQPFFQLVLGGGRSRNQPLDADEDCNPKGQYQRARHQHLGNIAPGEIKLA